MSWQGAVLLTAVVGAILLSKLSGLARPATDANNHSWLDAGHGGCDADGGHDCD